MDLHTGTPFWKTQNAVPHPFPRLEENETCDIAVLGGGITGALVSHYLQSQSMRVVVLEGRKIGQGSTLASTSLLSHAPDTHLKDLGQKIGLPAAIRVYRLGLEAIDKIDSLTRSLGSNCGFERKKSLYFASTGQGADELHGECEARMRAGMPAEFWDAKAVERHCAFRAPAAIWSKGDAQIDAYALTIALLRRLSQHGVGIYENTCVSAIDRTVDGFAITTDVGRQVLARHLVFATGYESQEYLRTRRAELVSTFAVSSQPLPRIPGWPEDCLIWETARPYLYMRRTPDGRVMVGGEDEPGALTHVSPELVAKKSRKLQDRFREMFPHVSFEPFCSWGGTFVDSPDGLPYIGTHEEFPGPWFALGYGGNGITFAVVAAEIIAAGICGTPSPDAGIFRFNRP